MSTIRWTLAIGGAFGAMAVLVALAFGWVAIYAYLIHTGEADAFYQEYAQTSSPIIGIVGGVPVYYFVCRFIAARGGFRSAIACWGVSAAISLATLAAQGITLTGVLLCFGDIPLKFAAAWFGGRAGERSHGTSGNSSTHPDTRAGAAGR